jgi:hypothetical protein
MLTVHKTTSTYIDYLNYQVLICAHAMYGVLGMAEQTLRHGRDLGALQSVLKCQKSALKRF